jgi:hypothetical protein
MNKIEGLTEIAAVKTETGSWQYWLKINGYWNKRGYYGCAAGALDAAYSAGRVRERPSIFKLEDMYRSIDSDVYILLEESV